MKKAVRAHRSAVPEANWQQWISEGGTASSGAGNGIVHAPRNGQNHVSPDAIARLAYALWEERGRPEGSAEQDWLRAEHQLVRTPDSR